VKIGRLGSGTRSSFVYFGIAFATIAAGLALRLIPLGLPFLVTKWGGSLLWAGMVYWLLAALLRGRKTAILALAAGILAALVELTRLYHSAGLDAFRLTLAGKLLLGRMFSYWDIVAYWAAILLAALADRNLIRSGETTASPPVM
jgi:hypothetical protein